MRLSALLRVVVRPVQRGRLLRDRLRVMRHHAISVPAEHRDLTVIEIDDVPRVADDGARIGRDEQFAGTDAEHNGAPETSHYDFFRFIRRYRRDAVCAADVTNRRLDCRRQILALFHRFFDEMREDFRVGLGLECVTARDEFRPQFRVILDDAVVHDCDAARTITVRMRIRFCRRTVRGPSRVRDADRRV